MTASIRTVGDCLRVPYLVTAQSQPLPDGTWVRHVEHPELPDCTAQAESITEALSLLDHRRIEVVLTMLAGGERPPAQRAPIGDQQARHRVRRAGLTDRVSQLWNRDADSLAATDWPV
ncbi:type II toxin-antitoxin system HicB family antitoxin [Streptomyces sp. NPDC088747]|uniref:type II toxin-antitoxin system HicB family antitoxin n=1 Tax=Streptomyces sp. NPDC088747 TaxID=3365886 RepID=UPI003830F3F2